MLEQPREGTNAGEGRVGRPAGHLLLTIELGNIYSFPSDPKQRGCGGKVGPTQHRATGRSLGLGGGRGP